MTQYDAMITVFLSLIFVTILGIIFELLLELLRLTCNYVIDKRYSRRTHNPVEIVGKHAYVHLGFIKPKTHHNLATKDSILRNLYLTHLF